MKCSILSILFLLSSSLISFNSRAAFSSGTPDLQYFHKSLPELHQFFETLPTLKLNDVVVDETGRGIGLCKGGDPTYPQLVIPSKLGFLSNNGRSSVLSGYHKHHGYRADEATDGFYTDILDLVRTRFTHNFSLDRHLRMAHNRWADNADLSKSSVYDLYKSAHVFDHQWLVQHPSLANGDAVMYYIGSVFRPKKNDPQQIEHLWVINRREYKMLPGGIGYIATEAQIDYLENPIPSPGNILISEVEKQFANGKGTSRAACVWFYEEGCKSPWDDDRCR